MVTFEEIEEYIIRENGETSRMLERMKTQVDEHNVEKCDICGLERFAVTDTRGLIIIPDDDKIWKIHWSCIIKLIKKYKSVIGD